jgi:hypothetical protein
MKNNNCVICGLEFDSMHRRYNYVVKLREGEAHPHCKILRMGVVPECPFYENITPRPCSNECVQARLCPNSKKCNCKCENLGCDIGQSVIALRAEGKIPWKGYIPLEIRYPSPFWRSFFVQFMKIGLFFKRLRK